MDRNQAIGLVIMTGLLFVYFFFLAPQPEKNVPGTIVSDSTTTSSSVDTSGTDPVAENQEELLPDSLRTAMLQSKYGPFASAASGEEREITIENIDIIARFSTKGGYLKYVELKNFKTYNQEPLVLLDEEHSEIDIEATTPNGFVNLSELYFTTNAGNRVISEDDSYTFDLTLTTSTGGSLTYRYTIPGTGYKIGYEIMTSNMGNVLREPLAFRWVNHQKLFEKDIEDVRQRATVKWSLTDRDVNNIKERSTSDIEKTADGPVLWASSKQKFFNSSILSEGGALTGGQFKVTVDESDPTVVKTTTMNLNMEFESFDDGSMKLAYFVGPNNYKMLKKIAPEFESIVYLGYPLVSWVNKLIIINIFSWLESFIGNYGLIIFILVLLIKLALSPLSYSSYKSTAKTKVLKPEIDAIKAKYGDDMQKVQQEQMQLYQKAGVNPLAGCIPLLLQMPFLLAMFFFFPNSIELRQEAFLWADDLSSYDSILNLPFTIPGYGSHVSLFTILMTASTILITWSNQQVTTVQGPMKSLSYIMPLVFMFVLNSFPAALSYYYFVSNIVTFGQQALIKQFIDEDKIRKIMEENRKKNANKKKSGFQARLEQAMKAAEENKKKK